MCVMNTIQAIASRMMHAALPQSLKRRKASWVKISCNFAHLSWSDWTGCVTDIAGLTAIKSLLAGRLRCQRVRANVIRQGAIDAPLNQKRIEEEADYSCRTGKLQAIGLMRHPEGVARIVLFFTAVSFISSHDLWPVADSVCCPANSILLCS